MVAKTLLWKKPSPQTSLSQDEPPPFPYFQQEPTLPGNRSGVSSLYPVPEQTRNLKISETSTKLMRARIHAVKKVWPPPPPSICKKNAPKICHTMGVRMAWRSLKIKGSLQTIWHANPKIWHTNPPLLCHMNRFYWGWGWFSICFYRTHVQCLPFLMQWCSRCYRHLCPHPLCNDIVKVVCNHFLGRRRGIQWDTWSRTRWEAYQMCWLGLRNKTRPLRRCPKPRKHLNRSKYEVECGFQGWE